MSQHYPNPWDVEIPDKCWSSKSLRDIIERDGLIVPILVNKVGDKFVAADNHQARRVEACRYMQWDTILVETEWKDEDL